jgi:hypothetical protein
MIATAETPLCIPGFDPATDMLLIALPDEAALAGDHRLDLRHLPDRDLFEVVLTLRPGRQRLILLLPGVRALDGDAVVLITPDVAEAIAPTARFADTATLTGNGLYPVGGAAAVRQGAPSRMRFTHRHDWHRDGPPCEQFFDLSDPASELSVNLDDSGGGPIYAVRFTEQAGHGAVTDTHNSIILVQTAPGTPRLTPGALTQWFATRLGTPDMRAIAWIWLGNEGSWPDADTGAPHRFGFVNRTPALSLTGPITASVEITR